MSASDDRRVGRLLSRREAMALLGAAGGALLGGSYRGGAQSDAPAPVSPSCVVRPEQEQGPYYLDEQLNRSDIRSDPLTGAVRPGVRLALEMAAYRAEDGRCTPIRGALIDLWQCDADGIYSDVKEPHFNTIGQKFLRGSQATDAAGVARFVTIYPGWYPSRTVHIHFKIRTAPGSARSREFISQLYFSDALSDQVFTAAPYARRGVRPTKNARDLDFIEGGRQLTLAPTPASDGYSGTFAIGLVI
jgi:protocatechuate 3,4-dioxygenase beta subunit